MFIRSGYRSYASQESVLNSFINKYRNRGYSYEEARRLALQTASLPGCSEHQSGLAVDINATGGTSSYTAYAWLAKNAYKYGFILRYPSGKESITGIEYEPWHYRYVGIGEAEKIKDSGLCLEEYLGGYSKYEIYTKSEKPRLKLRGFSLFVLLVFFIFFGGDFCDQVHKKHNNRRNNEYSRHSFPHYGKRLKHCIYIKSHLYISFILQ